MATRATNITAEEAHRKIRTLLRSIKNQSDTMDTLLASDVERERLLLYGVSVEQNYNEMLLQEAPGITEIDAYAKVAESDDLYDFATEYAATKTAILNVLTTIRSSFPESAGYLLIEQFEGPATLETISGTFSAASMTTIRGLVQTLSASIA